MQLICDCFTLFAAVAIVQCFWVRDTSSAPCSVCSSHRFSWTEEDFCAEGVSNFPLRLLEVWGEVPPFQRFLTWLISVWVLFCNLYWHTCVLSYRNPSPHCRTLWNCSSSLGNFKINLYKWNENDSWALKYFTLGVHWLYPDKSWKI